MAPKDKGKKTALPDSKGKTAPTDSKGNKSVSTTMPVRSAAASSPNEIPQNEITISLPTCFKDVQEMAASPAAKNLVLNKGLNRLEEIVEYVDGKLCLIEGNMTKKDGAETDLRNVGRYLEKMLSVAKETAMLQTSQAPFDMEFFKKPVETYTRGMDMRSSFPP